MPWHVTNSLVDRRLLCRSIADRRVLAATVLRLGRPRGLLAFNAPDDHLHLLVDGTREEAGEAARVIEGALTRRLGHSVGFGTPWFVEVQGRPSMERVLAYILDQARHHGVQADPLSEASNLPDLLGLRLNGAWMIPIARSTFTRLDRRQLLEWAQVPSLDGPGNPLDLPEAAASAVATPSGVPCAQLRLARAAAWREGLEMGMRRTDLAELLGLSAATARRLGAIEVPEAWRLAIRRQLAFRASRPMAVREPEAWSYRLSA